MATRIIFWSEFPEKVDWKTIDRLLEKNNLVVDVYVAVSSKKNYLFWKKTIKKNCKHISLVGAWPVLEKEKGYWFSGFTMKGDIEFLDEFKSIPMKIDLEPPLPKGEYSNARIITYFLKLLFKKGRNNHALQEKIRSLSAHAEILVNEFPLPALLLRRWGIFYPGKEVKKNIMCYTSIAGGFLQPFIRLYNFLFVKFKRPYSCSLGLIGVGILEKEGIYHYTEEFEADLIYATKFVKAIAVYSLEAILKRNDPNAWFASLGKYAANRQPAQSR